MNKLLPLIYITLFFAFTSTNAQNFPYLNASTGNKSDFIIDADSNIIMFHGSKIEKLDKNFNLIWANSYSELKIKNLLLSKTGSLFFISNSFTGSGYVDRVGKIEANGNLSWSKQLPTYSVTPTGTQTSSITTADQLFFDRNANLIVTGTTQAPDTLNIYLLKLDTLGNPLNLKLFRNEYLFESKIASIISDISGIYTISIWGTSFESAVFNLVLKYSDITDSIITSSICLVDQRGFMNETPISNEHILKSKNESNSYYLAYNKGAFSSSLYNTFNLKKFRDTVLVWGIEFQTSTPYVMSLQDIEEDHLKNLFLSISTKNINTDKTDKWIVKLDSTGISDNMKHNFMQNFGKATFGVADSITQLKHHFGNKYFYSIQSSTSLTSSLSIIKMDSTIGSYCSPFASINVFLDPGGLPLSNSQSTLTAASSFSMQSKPSTITNLVNYSITISSCLPLSVQDHGNIIQLSIYPSPASNKINVEIFGNYTIDQVSVFDVSGKQVLASVNDSTIDISRLCTGIYFIKIKTNTGEFSRKFIKD